MDEELSDDEKELERFIHIPDNELDESASKTVEEIAIYLATLQKNVDEIANCSEDEFCEAIIMAILRARGAYGPDSIGLNDAKLIPIVQWAWGIIISLNLLSLMLQCKIEPSMVEGEVAFRSVDGGLE